MLPKNQFDSGTLYLGATYGLSQRRAAEIAGGGVNAFSRYENGKAKPVAAVSNLFRLLDKHPELMNELAA